MTPCRAARIRRVVGVFSGVCLVAMAGSSCRMTGTEDEMKTRFGEALAPQKQTSLGWWKKRSLEGEPPGAFLNNRIALLSRASRFSIEKTGPNSYTLKMGGGQTIEIGSAAALSKDGYFLTAAHCEGLDIFTWSGPPRLVTRRVRTVWRGDPAKGGPDLAIVHASVRPPLWFSLAPAKPLSKRTRVLAGGFGAWSGLEKNPGGSSGGRVLRFGPWRDGKDGARWRELSHSAPLVPGDSGGPVVTEDGKLLGVSSTVSGNLVSLFSRDFVAGYESMAVCPDAAWIDRLIEKDRARRG